MRQRRAEVRVTAMRKSRMGRDGMGWDGEQRFQECLLSGLPVACKQCRCSTALCPLGAERKLGGFEVEPEVCQDPQLESAGTGRG